ncbi:polysaccharide biosynthesis/export family protein [Inquilinus sp. YAF38]|uniref:polysaccharide biosynthesis/export family protein n=1 Tax=Inquilinus sp. YAF38 TaxID=3233084 RepID=UPI003F8FEFA7
MTIEIQTLMPVCPRQSSNQRMARRVLPYLIAGLLWMALAPPARAADGAYHIGPGDTLMITVYGQETLTGRFRVGPDGMIGYPLLGEVDVGGLSTTEIAKRIGVELEEHVPAGKAISVSIEEYAPVFVLGEIEKPGPYPYRPGMIALELLAVGGGLKQPTLAMDNSRLQLISTEQDYTDNQLLRFSLQVRRARLKAEMDGAEDFSFVLPTHDSVQDIDALNRIVESEKNLFTVRKASMESQDRAMLAQRASYEQEIATLEQAIKLHSDELALLAEDVKAMQTLADQKLTQLTRLRETQRSYSVAQRDMLEQQSYLARAHQNLLDIEQRRVELRSKQSDEDATGIREADLEIARSDQRMASLLTTLAEMQRQATTASEAVATLTTTYTITRLVDGQYQEVAADERAEIKPGDILRATQKIDLRGPQLTLK